MQIQKTIATLNLFVFSWVGLGTPFIWLAKADLGNAQLWRGAMSGLLLVLLLSSFLICLLQFKRLWTFAKDNWILLIFLAYLFASLFWSPITIFEKLLVALGLGLCCSIAFSTALNLSLTERFEVIFFSLTAAFSPVLILNAVTHLHYLPVILLALGFSFAAAVFLYFDLFRPYSLLVLLVVFLLGSAILFSLDFSAAKKTALLWETGAFSNRNLFNRLVQILLVMALLISVLRGSFSEIPKPVIAFSAVLIGLLSSFYLILHKAATGQLVLLATTLIYFSWIFVLVNGFARWRRWLLFAICFSAVATLLFVLALAWNLLGLHDQISIIVKPFLEDYNVAFRFSLWKTAVARLEPINWIFGAGLDGFWGMGERLAADMPKRIARQAHAHNGMIDIFLQIGFIGTFLFLMILIQFFLRCLRQNDILPSFQGSIIFSLLIFMNLTESTLLPVSSANFLCFVLFLWITFKSNNFLKKLI